MSRPFNPRVFCISCGHDWGVAEEVCPRCGFDPVNNLFDREKQVEAEELWDLMQQHR